MNAMANWRIAILGKQHDAHSFSACFTACGLIKILPIGSTSEPAMLGSLARQSLAFLLRRTSPVGMSIILLKI